MATLYKLGDGTDQNPEMVGKNYKNFGIMGVI